jgi:hypothetical protein
MRPNASVRRFGSMSVRRSVGAPEGSLGEPGMLRCSALRPDAGRLAATTWPYLRQHADNPVDWRECGADAFVEARECDVPTFPSVGYSACHWCHVMAHESVG